MANYSNNDTTAPNWVCQTPYIYNVALTTLNTQYSQALPEGCKKFRVSIQDGVSTDSYRVSFVTGKVATPTAPYLTFTAEKIYEQEDLALSSVTLYLASASGSKTAQIEAWV